MGTSTTPALAGLIHAWRFAPGATERLDEAGAARALAAGEASLWLHFDLVDVRAQALLRGFERIPEAARALLVEPDVSVHLDIAPDWVSGTLPDFHYEAETGEIGLLHFALSQRLLITARRHPLQGAQRAAEGGRAVCPTSALAAILRAIVAALGEAHERLSARLTRFEDMLLRDIRHLDRTELAAIRRHTLRLQRGFGPVAQLLAELAEQTPDWVRGVQELPREAQRLSSALRALGSLQERGRIAQDTLLALSGEETNRRLFVLSVLSAAILPATLISGIFGMNVGGLPGVEREWGFAMAFALILVSILGVLGMLRLLRLL
jgi:zinc transporter